MYWLFDETKQEQVRSEIESLVFQLSKLSTRPTQEDQLFPFVGRKDRRKSAELIKCLTKEKETVCDPFAGSGMLVYAAVQENRNVLANEFELYTNRMANAPWKLPSDKDSLMQSFNTFCEAIESEMKELYRTVCVCGYIHVLDSLFFDRQPLTYINVTHHERLGVNGENITYRGKYKCPVCKRTEKYFDKTDAKHLDSLNEYYIDERFNAKLIENSRINLSKDFLEYFKLFPKRSIIVLEIMWKEFSSIEKLITHTKNVCEKLWQL